ncbi:MAG TPA: monovalent cation/H+ antiporter subunit D, partial [Marinobacter sp.]
IAFSRAGSIVFWRNVDGHIEAPQKLTPSLSVSASALISLSVVIVILAGPISRYADATAAQLHDTDAYTGILSIPMVGEKK